MVAPIISFVCAAVIGFLAWKLSTVESYLPPDDPEPMASSSSSYDDEPAAEPAEESSDEAE